VSPKDNASKYPSKFAEPGRNNKMEPNFYEVFLLQLMDMQIEENYLRKKKGMT